MRARTARKPTLTLARVLVLVAVLTVSHYVAYRWPREMRLAELRHTDEVLQLGFAVHRATLYLDKGPGPLREQSWKLLRMGLPASIMVTEQSFLPMAREAGRAEEVARLEAILVKARKANKILASQPKPPG